MTSTHPRGMVSDAGVRAASHMPSWLGSIRMRIAVLYSVILFGLAGLVVAGIYLALARELDNEPVYRQYVTRPVPGGVEITSQDFRTVESVVNEQTLERLRTYSFGALLILFAGSIGVGWVVAGRVLRPIEGITEVAREIQATDLSRRISLEGPDDELKQLADTFDDMLGRIDEAFASQREFIHEASHELRNPLAVMRTNLEVTLGDPDASVDDLRHMGEVVHTSSERMARLVDDLLVYARQGQLSLDRQRVALAGVVAEATAEFGGPALDAGVALTTRVEGAPVVVGDRLALRQAVANLLANALRVSPAGTAVEVATGVEGAWAWLAVTDHGPGIPEADQERVFQRFWRGDPTTARDQRRSGLGLTIVRQVAEAHGGEVRLRSASGEGSSFAVWIPLAPPA